MNEMSAWVLESYTLSLAASMFGFNGFTDIGAATSASTSTPIRRSARHENIIRFARRRFTRSSSPQQR
jgi:hypothetical protein